MAAATAGDDYELLFTLPPDTPCPVGATCIGTVSEGGGLTLTHHGAAAPLPASPWLSPRNNLAIGAARRHRPAQTIMAAYSRLLGARHS